MKSETTQSTERFAAFLFYIDDWLSSTAVDLMTADEERGYLRLLLHSWKAPDCGLPNDDRVLARLSKLEDAWKAGSGAVVRAEFIEKDGRLYNARLVRERQYQRLIRDVRSKAGKAGADSRWSSKGIVMPIAKEQQMERQKDANSNSNSNPEQTHCSSDDERGAPDLRLIPSEPGKADELKEWFDREFWPVYPRKVAKPQALKAARRHGKTFAARTLVMECLKRRLPALNAQLRSDGDFRPYPASWLNSEPWSEPETEDRPAVAAPFADVEVARLIEERIRERERAI